MEGWLRVVEAEEDVWDADGATRVSKSRKEVRREEEEEEKEGGGGVAMLLKTLLSRTEGKRGVCASEAKLIIAEQSQGSNEDETANQYLNATFSDEGMECRWRDGRRSPGVGNELIRPPHRQGADWQGKHWEQGRTNEADSEQGQPSN
ncbi:hypothetical protein EYF80_018165 [Liparis tanakae]|uniref:Uncharacterized protein n=1 Tax=Liparis tanakae TaxID=230148 RepID=A0A4Z2I1E9_9TELE|nr:hypothetical protein EYF80_018165 [Liparis tanakae]